MAACAAVAVVVREPARFLVVLRRVADFFDVVVFAESVVFRDVEDPVVRFDFAAREAVALTALVLFLVVPALVRVLAETDFLLR